MGSDSQAPADLGGEVVGLPLKGGPLWMWIWRHRLGKDDVALQLRFGATGSDQGANRVTDRQLDQILGS